MLQLLVRAITIISLLTNTTSWAAVGKVTDQTGPTEIVRHQKSLESQTGSPIEMQDIVVTAKSRAELTFEDKTRVKITEQSKLIIDDFVYDPKQHSGQLSIKVALGTAKYTSGQIAKTNPQNVNIKTPTASIAVRGTDFSMTVDELGRSLVMLLPSCDKKACVTGAIEVKTDAGSVYMDIAYQTTYVSDSSLPPSRPVIIKIDPENINNLLIISPPKGIKEDTDTKKVTTSEIDINYLDQDFLEYKELDQNLLEAVRELDIDQLELSLLINILDISAAELSQDLLAEDNKLLPNYNPLTGLKYYFNDDESKIILYRNSSHRAQITSTVEENKTINLKQDGIPVVQSINHGGSTIINIIQK